MYYENWKILIRLFYILSNRFKNTRTLVFCLAYKNYVYPSTPFFLKVNVCILWRHSTLVTLNLTYSHKIIVLNIVEKCWWYNFYFFFIFLYNVWFYTHSICIFMLTLNVLLIIYFYNRQISCSTFGWFIEISDRYDKLLPFDKML